MVAFPHTISVGPFGLELDGLGYSKDGYTYEVTVDYHTVSYLYLGSGASSRSHIEVVGKGETYDDAQENALAEIARLEAKS